jgi:hypothetical protein
MQECSAFCTLHNLKKNVKIVTISCSFLAFVCPSGAKEVGGICIRYHEGSYHWSQARNECKRRYGTDLLVIRNNAVFRDVQNAVQGRGGKLCIILNI